LPPETFPGLKNPPKCVCGSGFTSNLASGSPQHSQILLAGLGEGGEGKGGEGRKNRRRSKLKSLARALATSVSKL